MNVKILTASKMDVLETKVNEFITIVTNKSAPFKPEFTFQLTELNKGMDYYAMLITYRSAKGK